MYDFLIIGAGVTGITLCKKLREKGIDNVCVLEKENEVGGLCRTRKIDGHILDTGGGISLIQNISWLPTIYLNICQKRNLIIINGFQK